MVDEADVEQVWPLLEVAAQRAFLQHVATSPLARAAPPGSPVCWVITGVFSNTHNGVAATKLTQGNADAEITAVVDRLSGYPAIWHLGDGDTPTDLPARLIEAGCQPERSGVVMGRPTSGAVMVAPPRGIEVREVTAARELEAWRRVAAGVWPDSTDSDLRRQAALYAGLPLGPGAAWRHWLAWTADRVPVGMVSGMFTSEAVMVEDAGVLPGHRGAGIGAALITTVVGDAAECGVPFVVLDPTQESRPLYERLGFTLQAMVPERQFYLPGPIAPT